MRFSAKHNALVVRLKRLSEQRISKSKMFGSLLTLIVFSFSVSSADEWGYDEHHGIGPSRWKESYPDCGKNKQSPIDIDTGSVEFAGSLNKFTFTGYDSISGKFEIINNGHTVQVNMKTDNSYITGGSLARRYKLAQFHVHWGADNQHGGSEHTVNDKRYPLEIHFVHYSDEYSSLTEAVNKPNGLAVLGVFAEVTNPSVQNPAFEGFLKKFDEVKNKGSKQDIDTFSLSALLPKEVDREQYFRYEGSLTTPPCYESVVWTVFNIPIQISKTQMNEFRTLNHNGATEKDEVIEDNFRPVQPIGSRTVLSSFHAPPRPPTTKATKTGKSNGQHGNPVNSSYRVQSGAAMMVGLLQLAWMIPRL